MLLSMAEVRVACHESHLADVRIEMIRPGTAPEDVAENRAVWWVTVPGCPGVLIEVNGDDTGTIARLAVGEGWGDWTTLRDALSAAARLCGR